jgi:fatty acid-binding protein DegV
LSETNETTLRGAAVYVVDTSVFARTLEFMGEQIARAAEAGNFNEMARWLDRLERVKTAKRSLEQ